MGDPQNDSHFVRLACNIDPQKLPAHELNPNHDLQITAPEFSYHIKAILNNPDMDIYNEQTSQTSC